MNTPPSPAPRRRRRDTQPVIPRLPDEPIQLEQDAPAPARRRRSAAQSGLHESGRNVPARRSAPSARLAAAMEAIPPRLRTALLIVLACVFLMSAAAITRSYLSAQEERRRLEAEAAERAQHPLYYAELIEQYAASQGLDPALVSAIILCESSFDPMAESRLGARGLMQLMEDTAAWVAHKLGEDGEDYSFDKLYDPQTNIRFGTWYLGYLSRRFDGDAKKIVCAYHAGQGNVDSWLSNPQYSSDGVTLDTIPTQDTAAYASRVLRAQAVYRKYYFPQPSPSPAM